jgi:predicted metal-dependent peptidase
MSKIKDRKTYEKIVRARTALLISNGFFGCLALQLRIVECAGDMAKEVPTAAVDGKSFYYNPDFISELSDRETEFVWAHECMHCCFMHFSRRGQRHPIIWNIAGDHCINLDLKASNFTLITPRVINGHQCQILEDPKYAGWTTEEVYDDIMKNAKFVKVTLEKGMNDPGGCGGVRDAPGDANEKDETKHTWEVNLRAAVAVAQANNAGNIPGSLRHLIENLNQPKISWRDQTQQFVDQSMTKEISWSRLSRRTASTGLLMPGTTSDRLQKLVFFVDISGSVSFEMAKQMTSEVAGALDQGTADCVVVAYADTKVQHDDVYVAGDIVTCGRYSGGGTDFADSFKWLSENHPDASCVIYLTDLQVNNFGIDPGCPVMWAVYGPKHSYDQLIDRVPFGFGLHVSEDHG